MDIMKHLLEGYREFCQDYFAKDNSMQKKLAVRQKPKVLVIACSDSRVDPAIIMHAEPGDLFTVRNVANIVPKNCKQHRSHHGVSAAIEYAVKHLQVEHILILGHCKCGGIQALLDGVKEDDSDFIGTWVSVVKKAKVKAEAAGLNAKKTARLCELEAIKISIDNLLTFPWLAERVEQGKLKLHGWHYDFTDGQLSCLEAEDDEFKRVDFDVND